VGIHSSARGIHIKPSTRVKSEAGVYDRSIWLISYIPYCNLHNLTFGSAHGSSITLLSWAIYTSLYHISIC